MVRWVRQKLSLMPWSKANGPKGIALAKYTFKYLTVKFCPKAKKALHPWCPSDPGPEPRNIQEH